MPKPVEMKIHTTIAGNHKDQEHELKMTHNQVTCKSQSHFQIQGKADHDHTVVINKIDYQELQNGKRVNKHSGPGGKPGEEQHTHIMNIHCTR